MQMIKNKFLKLVSILKAKYDSSDIIHRIANGAFWSFTGTAMAKAIVLFSGIVCARILSKAQYGEFGMVRSTINMFVVFGTAGIGLTATKYISEYRKAQQARINSIYILSRRFSIITGTLVTFIVFALASFLAKETLHAPHLTNSIRIGAILLFFTVLNASQNGTLSGLERFKDIAINTLKGSIAETFFMLIGAYLGGVHGAILGYGCGFIVLYISNHVSIHRAFSEMGIRIDKQQMRREDISLLYKFTLPAALSSFLVMPAYWIIRAILVRTNGFEALAVYEAAEQWRVIILFIPSAVSQIILPILSSLTGTENKKFGRVLFLNLSVNVMIAASIALIVMLFSGFIMNMYGKEYSNNWPLIILSLSTIFSAISNVVGSSIASLAKMWAGFLFNFFWAFMIIFFSCLLSSYGVTGIACAVLFSYIIHSMLQLIYLWCIAKNRLFC